jgi:hypothetical protein
MIEIAAAASVLAAVARCCEHAQCASQAQHQGRRWLSRLTGWSPGRRRSDLNQFQVHFRIPPAHGFTAFTVIPKVPFKSTRLVAIELGTLVKNY